MYKYTKIKGLDWGGSFTSLLKSKNVMNMARYFVHRRKKRPPHHKTHLHTMKVYNSRPVSLTIEVLLIKIPLFLTIIHLFQSNQRFQAIRFVDRLVPEKLDIFGINLS